MTGPPKGEGFPTMALAKDSHLYLGISGSWLMKCMASSHEVWERRVILSEREADPNLAISQHRQNEGHCGCGFGESWLSVLFSLCAQEVVRAAGPVSFRKQVRISVIATPKRSGLNPA
jgi:hypothetical protein